MFRRTLRKELRSWREEGLADEKLADALTERYGLDRLGSEAHGVLMSTIFIVGAVLIGCGIVAFVAAHWADIPRWWKVGMLLAAMLAAHAGGYYLWQVRKPARQHLGHALTVLGTLIFGANIALLAQIFHVSERFYNGFGAWALGALFVALALKSVPNAVIAVAASFVWFTGFVSENDVPFLIYPVLVAAVFLPVSYWWRSRVVFVLAILAVTASLIVNPLLDCEHDALRSYLAFLLPSMVLWCYGSLHAREGEWKGFGLIARSLGALGLASISYVFSFHESAHWLGEELTESAARGEVLRGIRYAGGDAWFPGPADIALATPVVLALVIAAVAAFRRRSRVPRMLAPALAAAALLGAPFLPDPKIFATAGFNLIAVGLSAYGIFAGVRDCDRRPYWAGLGLLVLLIISRFFEYETDLMIKAVGFMAAGAILIYGGIKFEKWLRSHAAAEEVR